MADYVHLIQPTPDAWIGPLIHLQYITHINKFVLPAKMSVI